MLFSGIKIPKGFYIYFYLREDGTPYYVGKGKGYRAWVNHRGKSRQNRKYGGVQTPTDPSRILIVHSNLTEVGYNALERYWIRWYGRKDIGTGILHNRTDGGDGGSGKRSMKRGKPKDETIMKIKSSLDGRKWWNNGERYVYEHECPGPGWEEGKGVTTWNNGTKEVCQIKKPDGPDWVKGTLKVWWNNGKTHKYQPESPGPEWIKGRLEETNKKNGDVRRGNKMEIVTCPVCGATGGINAMKRNHFDNCGVNHAPSKGKKAYNKNGKTKFFSEDPGDGWVLGSHYCGELKVNYKSKIVTDK